MFQRIFSLPRLARPLALAAGFGLSTLYYQKTHQACGIIGVISTQGNAEIVVTDGIQLLQNRGYDSAGIVTFRKGSEPNGEVEVHLTKHAIEEEKHCIQKVVEEGVKQHKGSYIGIGHTRWATCGNKTSPNAHPHFDESHKYYLVHNGTIVNYKHIKEHYLKDVIFTSQTDTEVIVQLLAKICKDENCSTAQGLRKLQDILIGQWGLVVIDKTRPHQMHISTYGSPILVGLGNNAVYAASQTIAFEKYTKEYIETKNGEIFTLSLETLETFRKEMKDNGRILVVTNQVKIKIRPDPPFKSFYEEEVHEQGHLRFKPYLEELDSFTFGDNLTLLGCGSSSYAAKYAEHWFKMLHAFKKTVVLDAAEVVPEDIQEKESVVVVSQSGETKDLLNALEIAAQRKEVRTIGVINVVGSAVARKVNCPIYTNVGRQVAVGATKSFSHQILNLIGIAMRISENKGLGEEPLHKALRSDLEHITESFNQAIELAKKNVGPVADALKDKESIYILAKAEALAIAKEGALKIKELCYIHAEAFGASEMKHGPLALVDYENPKSSPVIFIINDDKNLPALKVAIDELHCRKAMVIVITNCIEQLNKEKIDYYIQVPKLEKLSSFLSLAALQLITNEICLRKGINPDKPRNLAKTVTV